MKIILATLAVTVLAVSSSFAQCTGCSGSKDGESKKDGKKESAYTQIVLE